MHRSWKAHETKQMRGHGQNCCRPWKIDTNQHNRVHRLCAPVPVTEVTRCRVVHPPLLSPGGAQDSMHCKRCLVCGLLQRMLRLVSHSKATATSLMLVIRKVTKAVL